MNRNKLRQLAKQINYDKVVQIKFVFESEDYFCYQSINNIIEISSFYYRLSPDQIKIFLVHEIGHMNTLYNQTALLISDYRAEYEANRWAMFRLDELKWTELLGVYTRYLQDLCDIEVIDEDDEDYRDAATDLLLELELI